MLADPKIKGQPFPAIQELNEDVESSVNSPSGNPETIGLLLGQQKKRYSSTTDLEGKSSQCAGEGRKTSKSSFYKNPHYLSDSAFRTLTEGIAETLRKPVSNDDVARGRTDSSSHAGHSSDDQV